MQTVDLELLRIYVGESDRHAGQPVYERIVHEARRMGLAGATVLRGTMGFGANSRIHTAKILHVSEDLPMVVEIVDEPQKIAALLPRLAFIGPGSLITLERVRVVRRTSAEGPASRPPP